MRVLCLLSLSVGIFLVAGCGPGKGAPVSGKIVFPPNVKLESSDTIQLSFMPEDSKMPGTNAKVNASDQTFTLNTVGMNGVMPGKYKVTIGIAPYPGMPENKERTPAFEPLNKAYDVRNSKLACEVTAGAENKFTIDLTKGTITKD